jgi:hypothetical protein
MRARLNMQSGFFSSREGTQRGDKRKIKKLDAHHAQVLTRTESQAKKTTTTNYHGTKNTNIN